ncbi:MAG: glycosyltransferase family 2 protein [Planctomycetota bacterium]|jgi:glycosyltransferase involved in cell wall biosynthesis|nr:glycosyltransferase family 2 protein [Planctomycetota bacterium]
MRDMISVVIPVYNVAGHLRACLESVVGQTYGDIEIILINDGSTDRSGDICEEWAAKDRRIRYLTKGNGGLGPTRNLGVKLCRGEYVLFVDSDDWVDARIVEKLHEAVGAGKAEIAFCDRYNYTRDGKLYRVEQDARPGPIEVKSCPEVVFGTYIQAWAKLIKKSVITGNDLFQSSGFYEDGTTPIWLATCSRVHYVQEPLYYYRFRDGAISDDASALSSLRNHFVTVRETFEKQGLFEEYRGGLERFFRLKIRNNLSAAANLMERKHREDREVRRSVFESIRDDLLRIYGETFGRENPEEICGATPKHCVVFGSYNLRRFALKYAGTAFPDRLEFYSQSSLGSVMAPYSAELNSRRTAADETEAEEDVVRDFTKRFAHGNARNAASADCLLVDLLEERHPLGEADRTLFTVSDSFRKVFPGVPFSYALLPRRDDRTERIWRENCLKFVDYCGKVFYGVPLILVRTMLTETYGLSGKEEYFDNLAEIRETNAFLASCYDFFELNCPRCSTISVAASEYYYTYRDCALGCVPWHLNNRMYETVGREIAMRVRNAAGAV